MTKSLVLLTLGILIGMFFDFMFSEQATEKKTQTFKTDHPPAYEIVIQMPPDYAPIEV